MVELDGGSTCCRCASLGGQLKWAAQPSRPPHLLLRVLASTLLLCASSCAAGRGEGSARQQNLCLGAGRPAWNGVAAALLAAQRKTSCPRPCCTAARPPSTCPGPQPAPWRGHPPSCRTRWRGRRRRSQRRAGGPSQRCLRPTPPSLPGRCNRWGAPAARGWRPAARGEAQAGSRQGGVSWATQAGRARGVRGSGGAGTHACPPCSVHGAAVPGPAER